MLRGDSGGSAVPAPGAAAVAAATKASSVWLLWLTRLIVIAEVACAIFFVGRQYGPLLDSLWVQDDAYVSFRYARNFVEGYGLVYNIGQRVEGYTNFLWTMLAVIPLVFGADDPLRFMHMLGIGLWAASYAALLFLGLRLACEGLWAAPLAVIPLTFHYSFNMWFVSAMETPLVSFLTIAAMVPFTADARRRSWALFWVSFTCVLLLLARPDTIFFFAGLVLTATALYGRDLLHSGDWQRYVIRPALPILLIFVPYTIWRVSYYGEFYPNTYYVKVAYLTYYERGWNYLLTYLQAYPFLYSLPFAVLGALLVRNGAAQRFLWGALGGSALVFFYVVRLGGDFMEWRFVVPVTGLLYPACVIGLAVSVSRLWEFTVRGRTRAPWPQGVAWAAGVAGATGLALATVKALPVAKDKIVEGQESIALLSRYWDPKNFNWTAAGKVFDEILPKGITIATSSAGIIPYFCNRRCIDLCGLTDPAIARKPVDPNKRGRMGHEHCTEEYFDSLRRGVDVYLHWVDPRPYPLSVVTEVPKPFEIVSVKLPDGRYTEFVILNKEKVDIEKLRQDPRLVFSDARVMSRRNEFYTVGDRYRAFKRLATIDLENYDWEQQFGLQRIEPRHDFHTKMLNYRPPFSDRTVYDDGFHIFEIRWPVKEVDARKELILIFRTDGVNAARYELEVNGRTLPQPIEIKNQGEVWDEIVLEIPPQWLVNGTNQFRLYRAPDSEKTAELFYLWALQPPDEGTAAPALGSGPDAS